MNPIGPHRPSRRSSAAASSCRRPLLVLLTLFAGAVALPGSLALLASAALAASAGSSVPVVSTLGDSGVAYSSATLYGDVNAKGLVTDFYFQYGASAAYGAQTPLAPAGNGTLTVKLSQAVSGLLANTLYHYRVVAVNSAGTAVGHDRTFKTAVVPLSVQIAGVPNPVTFGNPFFIEGNLSGTGAANHEVALQANAFPYLAGFKNVGNPELTNSTGGFSFPYVGLLENAQLRVVTVGKPLVVSPVIVEGVAVRVTFHVRRTRRHRFARLYGTVTPAEVGALIGFQLLRPGRSINEGGTNVKALSATVSRFSRIVHVRHPGLYRALVQVRDGSHVSAYSPPIFIR